MLKDYQDAFGHELHDYLKREKGVREIPGVVERDDGYISHSDTGLMEASFSKYRNWHPVEKMAMRYARGRVLDIGSGAGRHSLYLQGKGLEVLAIDNSPLAIEVCKSRGLRNAEVVPISQISWASLIQFSCWATTLVYSVVLKVPSGCSKSSAG